MTTTYSQIALSVLTCVAITFGAGHASAQTNRVTFPTNLDRLIHFTTVKRGDVTEHMLTTQEAIEAVKLGQAMPNGTHVVMVDYRDSKVFRYLVMQKDAGWGNDIDPAIRAGDWQFKVFKADKTVNTSENTARCSSCHQGQESSQHLFTFNDLKRFK